MTTKKLLCDYVGDFRFDIVESNASSGRMKVRGPIQKSETKNGNSRVYSDRLWNRVLADRFLHERVNNRQMLGEVEHPADGQTNLGRVSHIMTRVWKEGHTVFGEAEILNTPYGLIIQEMVRAGVPVGISSRGRGTSYERDGVEYINEDDYEVETWDFVYRPSTPGAFMAKVNESLSGAYTPESPMSEKMNELRKLGRTLRESRAAVRTASADGLRDLLRDVTEASTRIPLLSNDETRDFAEELSDSASDIISEIDTALSKTDTKAPVVEGDTKKPSVEEFRADYWKNRYEALRNSTVKDEAVSTASKQVEEQEALISRLRVANNERGDRISKLENQLATLQNRYDAAQRFLEGVLSRRDRAQVVHRVTELVRQHEALGEFAVELAKCENIDSVNREADKLLRAIRRGTPLSEGESTPILRRSKPVMGKGLKKESSSATKVNQRRRTASSIANPRERQRNGGKSAMNESVNGKGGDKILKAEAAKKPTAKDQETATPSKMVALTERVLNLTAGK